MRNVVRTHGVTCFGRHCRIAIAMFGGALSSLGCARLLGIDGAYVLDSEDHGGPSTGGAGNGGMLESGGAFGGGDGGQAGGGSGGLGSGGAAGGQPAETGGACTDCGLTACTPGTYSGMVSGRHQSSVIPLPLTISGAVAFRIEARDGAATAEVVDGAISGKVDVSGGFVTFDATLTGAVDCATGALTGQLDGSYSVVGPIAPPPISFSGAHTGAFTGGAFSGDWTETEAQDPRFKGSGTWNASRTGP